MKQKTEIKVRKTISYTIDVSRLRKKLSKMMAFKTDRTKCGYETMKTTKCKDKDLQKMCRKYFHMILTI